MADISSIIDPKLISELEKSNELIIQNANSIDKKLLPAINELLLSQQKIGKTTNNNSDERKKLSESQKESAKIQKQLEATEAKINSLQDKSTQALLKKRIELQKSTKATKDDIVANDKQAGTLERLAARNRQLQNEKKSLNLETSKGRKRLKEINKEQDKNNILIEKSSNKLQKQKINIGNYGSAFGSLLSPIQAAGMALKAFLANPVVAIVAGIVGAFKLLTSALKRSEEGQMKFNKAIAFLKGGLNVLLDVFTRLANNIIDAFENPKQAINDLWETIKTNLINRLKAIPDLFIAFGKVIKESVSLNFKEAGKAAKDAGKAFIQLGTGLDENKQKKFADSVKNVADEIKEETRATAELQKRRDELRIAERKFITERQRLRTEIELAREAAQDESVSLEERLRLNDEALKKSQQLADQEIKFAKERADILATEVALGESTAEDLEELENIRAEIFVKEQERARLSKRLLTERRTLESRFNAEKLAEEKAYQDEINAIEADFEAELNDQIQRELQAEQDKVDEIVRINQEGIDKRIEQERLLQQTKQEIAGVGLQLAQSATEAGLNIAKEGTTAQKALLIANAIAERANAVFRIKNATSIAATQALASPLPPPFPQILSGVYKGLGLAEAAAVISRPIPAFEKGTDYSPAGVAELAEGGRELVRNPDGVIWMAENRGLYNLERGSKVLTNQKTEAYLNDNNIVNELRATRKAITKQAKPIHDGDRWTGLKRGQSTINYIDKMRTGRNI